MIFAGYWREAYGCMEKILAALVNDVRHLLNFGSSDINCIAKIRPDAPQGCDIEIFMKKGKILNKLLKCILRSFLSWVLMNLITEPLLLHFENFQFSEGLSCIFYSECTVCTDLAPFDWALSEEPLGRKKGYLAYCLHCKNSCLGNYYLVSKFTIRIVNLLFGICK